MKIDMGEVDIKQMIVIKQYMYVLMSNGCLNVYEKQSRDVKLVRSLD